MTLSLRLLGLSMVVAACSLTAAAATPPTVEETSIKLDGIIETLKKDAVEFNSEAQDIEQTVLYPAQTRTSVYVSCNVSKLLLQNVTVTIDEGKPVRYDYDDRAAKALLLSDGMHRILLTNVEPGSHRIRVEFRAQFADADAGDTPLTGRFEESFEKTRKPADLELSISRYTRLSKPKMSLVVWKKSAQTSETLDAARQSKGQKRRVPR